MNRALLPSRRGYHYFIFIYGLTFPKEKKTRNYARIEPLIASQRDALLGA